MYRPPLAALALPALLLLTAPARAQNLVLVNATVDGHEGPVSIVIRKGKVRSVGKLARPPRDLPAMDVRGSRVVPGRIDAWAAVDGASPLGDARDGLDPFDPALVEALAQGVTTVCLVPRTTRSGSCGAASVVKLRPGKPLEVATVTSVVAVCAGLGGPDEGPLARLERLGALSDALDEAGRYRDEWAAYDEALAEWMKTQGISAVGTRAGTAPVASPSGDARGGTAPVGTRTAPPGGGRRRGQRPPGGGGPEQPAPRMSEDEGDLAAHVEDEELEPPPRPRRGRRGPTPGPTPEAQPEAAPGEAPRKPGDPPRRPRVDRGKALLGKVLAGEVPLLLQADRAEDLLSAVELLDRHPIRLVLVGLAEGHLVADALKGRERLSLILGPQALPSPPGGARPTWQPGEAADGSTPAWSARRPLRLRGDGAGLLSAAGLPLAIGSGSLAASRFVEQNAALAAGAGLSREAAEAGVTRTAAEVLGVADRLGRIAPDQDADLVVLGASADGVPPLPVLVLIEGEVAWRRSK